MTLTKISKKQFAALIFKIKTDTAVFRPERTTPSSAGRKTSTCSISIQVLQENGARCCKNALENLPGSFILTGHSKGEETWLLMQPVKWKHRSKTALEPSTAMTLHGLQLCHQKHWLSGRKLKGYFTSELHCRHDAGNTLRKLGLSKRTVAARLLIPFSWKIKGDSFLLLDTLDAESLQIRQNV